MTQVINNSQVNNSSVGTLFSTSYSFDLTSSSQDVYQNESLLS